jgi:hypothetical protein
LAIIMYLFLSQALTQPYLYILLSKSNDYKLVQLLNYNHNL